MVGQCHNISHPANRDRLPEEAQCLDDLAGHPPINKSSHSQEERRRNSIANTLFGCLSGSCDSSDLFAMLGNNTSYIFQVFLHGRKQFKLGPYPV